MSLKGDLYLGAAGAEVKLSPFGRQFSISTEEANRQERSANGTLKKDRLYVKHNFSISYTVITGNAVSDFESIFALDQPLVFLVYTADGVYDTYSVYMDAFEKTRMVLIADGLWGGVNIRLHEA